MKNNRHIVLIAICIVLASCKHSTQMLTIVNDDGSCTRECYGVADSAFMTGDTASAHNPFAIIPDSNWQITWQHASIDVHTNWPLKSWNPDTSLAKIPIQVKASRRFANADEMSRSFRLKPQHPWNDIKVTYQLTKQFRWFYTYFTYSETYPLISSLTTIPIDTYLTKEEARLWFNGSNDLIKGQNGIEIKDCLDDIESKFNKWFAHNLLDEEYEYLISDYHEIDNPPVSKQKLIASKNAFIQFALKNANIDIMADNKEFATYLDEFFKTNSFLKLYKKTDNPIKRFEKEFEKRPFLKYFDRNNLDYQLLMPGQILYSNTNVIKGDTLLWTIDGYRMAYEPLVLTASSRKANRWAFILSGVVILGAIGSFWIKR